MRKLTDESFLFLILGPSGVGKSTLVRKLIQDFPDLEYYPSHTTRSPRDGEIDGKDYHFIPSEEFLRKKADDEFIEIDQPHNSYYYGISWQPLISDLKNGHSFIKEVARNGLEVLQHSEIGKHVVSIFIKPEKFEDLKKRLEQRGSGNVEERLQLLEKEMYFEQLCKHKVVVKQADVDYAYGLLHWIVNDYFTGDNHCYKI